MEQSFIHRDHIDVALRHRVQRTVSSSLCICLLSQHRMHQQRASLRLFVVLIWAVAFFVLTSTVYGEPTRTGEPSPKPETEVAQDETLRSKTKNVDEHDGSIRDDEAFTKTLQSHLNQLGLGLNRVDRIVAQFCNAVFEEDSDRLDAYVEAIASVSPVAEQILSAGRHDRAHASAIVDPSGPQYTQLDSLPSVITASLRTWLGRELVRSRFFDEAMPVLAELDPTLSIAPEEALFYRGAAYHAAVMKAEALKDLRQLLRQGDRLPRRYERTAKLMMADLKPMKADSLDEVSRLMSHVTRRLDMGMGNQPTQEKEQEVIDKLDKLIEDLEKKKQQQQQQQQQQSKGGQGGQSQQQSGQEPSNPMQDSQIAGGSGAGDVDRKKIAQSEGWGNLPPAERQEALQQMGQDLPTHYREVIEAYFRKIAREN